MKELEEGVLRLLEEGPVTPDEAAAKLRVAWATAQACLLKLASEGRVVAFRKGRVNVYFLKAPRKLAFKAPPWAKVKDLGELAEELEGYFPADISAAEMVEKERRA